MFFVSDEQKIPTNYTLAITKHLVTNYLYGLLRRYTITNTIVPFAIRIDVFIRDEKKKQILAFEAQFVFFTISAIKSS